MRLHCHIAYRLHIANMASAKECTVNRTDLLIEKLEKLAAVTPVCMDKAFKLLYR